MTIHTRNGAIRARRLAVVVALLLAVAAQGADFSFNIPAGELKSALDAYIKQSGQQIVYKSDDVKGRTSPGVHGTLSDQQALDALLKGTGLQLRRDESGAVVVFPVEAVAGGASATGAGEQKLEEVVVTATAISHLYITSRTVTRIDTDPLLLPESVSTVQADLMYAQQASSITEVLDNVAGMDVNVSGGVSSRGFGVAAARNGTVQTGFYADSVRLRPVVATDRIEVVKGPEQIMQGALAGIGGTVNVVSKVPQPEDSAYLGTSVGSHEYYRVDADVNGTLLGGEDGRLMGMLIGSSSDEGNGRYGIKGESLDFVSAGLRWNDPGLGSDLSVVYEYQSTEQGPDLQAATLNDKFHYGEKEWLFGAKNSTSSFTEDTIDVNFTQRIWGSWNIAANYIWRDESLDAFAYSVFPDFSNPDGFAATQFRDDNQDNTSSILKIDLHGEVDTGPVQHKLMLAYDYISNDVSGVLETYLGTYLTDIVTGGQSYVPYDPPIEQTVGPVESRESGVLLTDQFNWNKWHALAGVRWVSQRNEVKDPLYGSKSREDATLPQFGLIYAMSSTLSLYGSWSEGFQSNAGLRTPNGQLLPNETFTQYEAGVKTIALNGQLALTIAAYQILETNKAELASCGETGCFYRTIKGLTSTGVEAEVSAQPVRGLQVRANFSYLDSSDDNTGDPPATGYVPLKFNLWTQYWFSREAGNGWWAGGGLTATDAPTRQDSGFFAVNLPGSTTLDLSCGYQGDHWNGVFGIKNVGNVGAYYPTSGYVLDGRAIAYEYPGREYRFDLSYLF
ncbi:MAG: TonB-dependent receptor [Steroidobacteraceae bacterium]